MFFTILVEVLGYAGMAACLGAFFLVSLKKIKTDSRIYQVMNLFSGITLTINAFVH